MTLGAVLIAAGLVYRIVAVDALWQVIVGGAIIGAGTGIGYAVLSALTLRVGPAELTSLGAYRLLFATCAAVSLVRGCDRPLPPQPPYRSRPAGAGAAPCREHRGTQHAVNSVFRA
ncbi:hypothetical protein [Streptomyces liangshanensis]|uniref:hypothetical protein n=1 Tax=Streptomyces liangshanensis TaxID=2717324 RepID=UPI0036DB7A51